MSQQEEFQNNLSKIKKQVSNHSDRLTNKVIVHVWKGSHDIKDNIAGVSLSNDKGMNIANLELLQLECDFNYLDLAKMVGEKLAEDLKAENYEVELVIF